MVNSVFMAETLVWNRATRVRRVIASGICDIIYTFAAAAAARRLMHDSYYLPSAKTLARLKFGLPAT